GARYKRHPKGCFACCPEWLGCLRSSGAVMQRPYERSKNYGNNGNLYRIPHRRSKYRAADDEGKEAIGGQCYTPIHGCSNEGQRNNEISWIHDQVTNAATVRSRLYYVTDSAQEGKK